MDTFPYNYYSNLPKFWDEKVSPEGRVYYVDHRTKKTQWFHPTSGKRKRVVAGLPPGWERFVDSTGQEKYVNKIKNITTQIDPRLPLVLEEKEYDEDNPRQADMPCVPYGLYQYSYLGVNVPIGGNQFSYNLSHNQFGTMPLPNSIAPDLLPVDSDLRIRNPLPSERNLQTKSDFYSGRELFSNSSRYPSTSNKEFIPPTEHPGPSRHVPNPGDLNSTQNYNSGLGKPFSNFESRPFRDDYSLSERDKKDSALRESGPNVRDKYFRGSSERSNRLQFGSNSLDDRGLHSTMPDQYDKYAPCSNNDSSILQDRGSRKFSPEPNRYCREDSEEYQVHHPYRDGRVSYRDSKRCERFKDERELLPGPDRKRGRFDDAPFISTSGWSTPIPGRKDNSPRRNEREVSSVRSSRAFFEEPFIERERRSSPQRSSGQVMMRNSSGDYSHPVSRNLSSGKVPFSDGDRRLRPHQDEVYFVDKPCQDETDFIERKQRIYQEEENFIERSRRTYWDEADLIQRRPSTYQNESDSIEGSTRACHNNEDFIDRRPSSYKDESPFTDRIHRPTRYERPPPVNEQKRPYSNEMGLSSFNRRENYYCKDRQYAERTEGYLLDDSPESWRAARYKSSTDEERFSDRIRMEHIDDHFKNRQERISDLPSERSDHFEEREIEYEHFRNCPPIERLRNPVRIGRRMPSPSLGSGSGKKPLSPRREERKFPPKRDSAFTQKRDAGRGHATNQRSDSASKKQPVQDNMQPIGPPKEGIKTPEGGDKQDKEESNLPVTVDSGHDVKITEKESDDSDVLEGEEFSDDEYWTDDETYLDKEEEKPADREPEVPTNEGGESQKYGNKKGKGKRRKRFDEFIPWPEKTGKEMPIHQVLKTFAVIPVGFPKLRSFTRDDANEVRKMIIHKIDQLELSDDKHPRFSGSFFRVGALMISCLDRYTCSWLSEIVKEFVLADGTKIMMAAAKVVRSSCIIGAYFPTKYYGEEKFLETLSFFNPLIDMSKWCVLQQLPVKDGIFLSIGAPRNILAILHERNYFLDFNNKPTKVTVMSKKNSGRRPPRSVLRKAIEDVIVGHLR